MQTTRLDIFIYHLISFSQTPYNIGFYQPASSGEKKKKNKPKMEEIDLPKVTLQVSSRASPQIKPVRPQPHPEFLTSALIPETTSQASQRDDLLVGFFYTFVCARGVVG